MGCYIAALKKYVDFKGRAGRPEFWMFLVINILITIGLVMLEFFVLGTSALSTIYALAIFLPSLALLVRRIHDTNRSGWWAILAFIPLFGAIAFIVFGLMKGTEGSNDYGPPPPAC